MRIPVTLLTLALVVPVSAPLAAQPAGDPPGELPTPISEAMDARIRAFVEQNERRGGTDPLDWRYELAEGVLVKQVTFYSNEQPVYAKIFYPVDFAPEGRWPAVALGHGYNAISIAIEKYGARFAERGLVAMVIDYRGYGFSDPWVRVLDPEDGVARERQLIREIPVELERTRLIHWRQVEDMRAAVSYLQGEPGVDPDRIGIWGSSYAGGVILNVAGHDARIKAAVGQVSSAGGLNATGPAAVSDALLEDQITRARTGRGAETIGGFSFRTLIGLDAQFWGREARPGRAIERIPETAAVLFIPAENEELSDPRGPNGPWEAVTRLKGPAKVYEIPHISHFHIYGGAAFDASSTAAVEWFLYYLGTGETDTGVLEVAE